MTTSGTVPLDFQLPGIPDNFSWSFHVAEVSFPILGLDFMSSNQLLIDCSARKLSRSRIFQKSSLRAAAVSFTPAAQLPDVPPIFKEFVQGLFSTPAKSSPTSIIRPQYCHSIDTVPSPPLRERVRPLSAEKLEFLKTEFKSLLDAGVIRRSSSPWASPIHIVAKNDGTFRVCGDYRRLNNLTIHDSYPMPLINDVLTRFEKSTIFSTVDLAKAYHQIPVKEIDIPKTAVTTPLGLFEYIRMPFGLRNASQTFQRHIDQVLSPLNSVVAYIDDIIIGSTDIESHKKDLSFLFSTLSENKLKINIKKCNFFKPEVKFLGHLISKAGIRPLPERLESISKFPKPELVTQLRSFLGVINYCHRFIPKISDILSPLSALSQGPKRSTVKWNPAADNAFLAAKDALLSITTLAFPKGNLPLVLTTDASDRAVGAILTQVDGDTSRPLEFFSRKLSSPQQRYSTFDRELLAIFMSIKHFRHLLEGREFKIFTDHKPLIHLGSMKDPSPRQQRQISFIMEFSCTIHYIAGRENVAADCFSRNSCAIYHDPLFSVETLRQSQPDQDDVQIFAEHLITENGISFDSSLPGTLRPILSRHLRKQAFNALHKLHHPGSAGTYELLRSRVIWPSMRRDVKLWVSECTMCQKNKVTRHIKPPLMHFPTGNRFDVLHIDLVGPLPIDDGYSYLLTMIDRKTRWFEVIPLKSISAPIVAKFIISEWFSRYGLPRCIITDRGAQFESQLFSHLTESLGIKHLRSTSYHPQTNGLLERFHRTLKQSLRILSMESSWTKALPYVLLGWRNTPTRTTESSPSQLLFGMNTTLPNELVDFGNRPSLEELDTARKHFTAIDSNPIFTVSNAYKPFIPKNLSSATHVWIKTISDSGLKPRYTGPFKLISIVGNYACVEINGVSESISLSRIKPAFGISIPITGNDKTDTMSIPLPKPDFTTSPPPVLSVPPGNPPPSNPPSPFIPDASSSGTVSPPSFEAKTEPTSCSPCSSKPQPGSPLETPPRPAVAVPSSILKTPSSFVDRPSANTRSRTKLRINNWVLVKYIDDPSDFMMKQRIF